MSKRNIKCYQCKFEKTDECDDCGTDYNKFEFLPEYNRRLVSKLKK